MKIRWLSFLCCAFLSLSAHAGDGLKPSEMKTKDALHAVITKQIAAFRVGDYKAAYVFADDGVKQIYPLEQFEKMVKSGFPVIAQSVAAKCGLTFDNGDEAVVNVRVTGAGEQSVDYQYTLRRDGGARRILGVVLLEAQTTSV